MDMLREIVGALAGIGGGLSLILIVLLVVGIALLGTVYVAAALVVIRRFGQNAHWGVACVVASLSVSGLIAAVLARQQVAELDLAPFAVWLGAWAERFAMLAPAGLLVAFVASRWGRSRAARFAPRLVGAAFVLGLLASFGSRLVIAIEFADPLAYAGFGLLTASVGWVLFGWVPLAMAGLAASRGGAEWFVATRYLVAERRQVFVSLITLICVAAVAAGVWLIITVLSVMNGFERTWRDEIVGNHAHFLVRSYYGDIVEYDDVLARIRAADGVVAASPYLEAEGLVRKAGGGIAPVRLRGIEPESAAQVGHLADRVVEGSLAALTAAAGEGAHPALILGRALAKEIEAAIGDEIVLISPFGGPETPIGPSPRLMRFRVVGFFESSFLQYDEIYAFSDLPAAQRFLATTDVVGGIAVKSLDFYRSRQIAGAVADELGSPFYSRDWKDLFPHFFEALKSNRSLMVMLLFMIMVVAAFVIVVTLMMMIMAKSADIAILKTMGASDANIERIFAIEGTLIGLCGVGLGVLAGVAVTSQLSWVQDRIEELTGVDTLPSSVYQISTLPSQVDPLQVLGVSTVAMVLALGATLLPSRHGARLDPVEGLRHD